MKILNMTENKYICNCKKYDYLKKIIFIKNRETTTDELDVIEFIKKDLLLKTKIYCILE